MEFVCDKCAKPTKNTDYIKCQGFCDTVAHFKCAGLNNQHFAKLKASNENILWFCDGCLKLIKFATFRPTIAALGNTIADLIKQQTDAINELKAEIRKEGVKATSLADKTKYTPRDSRNIWPAVYRPTQKRRREEQPISNRDIVAGTNTSLSTTIVTVPVAEKSSGFIYPGFIRTLPSIKFKQ